MTGRQRFIDRWFTAYNLLRTLRSLALSQAVLLAIVVAGSHGLFFRVNPSTTDFVSFYAAGKLAVQGSPALAYDEAAHRAAEAKATVAGAPYEYFFYPPTFLLICAPLARLPYLAAFLLFEATTCTLWLAGAHRITGGGRTAFWGLLACGPVWWTLGLGQNGFLSAGLLAAGTLALRRRPGLAGVCFGAMCFKPHFGLLIPLALASRRAWRAFSAAAATVIALVGLSAALFGLGCWRAFLRHELGAGAVLYHGPVHLSAHVEPRGAAMLAGAPEGLAWAASALVALLALAATLDVWRRGGRFMPEAALAAGALACAPFALFYDLMLATVAAAWLIRAGRERGFLPGERAVLGIAFGIALVAYPLAIETHLQGGALVAPALLALAWRRSRRETAEGSSAIATAALPCG